MNVQPSELTRERQRRAAEPSASAWVAANAGSGKTTVLANRVIRLLLADVEPPRILCLTFTKAAAANMSNRVFGVLAKWATAPDAELDEALRNLGEPAATPALRARARRLFARALETPGGLKVLTIHAFCERLLHQFPFEAAVPAAFTVLDERQQKELVAEARAEVLTLAATGGPLGAALSRLVQATSDGAMSKALDALLIRGEALAELLRPDGADASAKVSRRLATALGLAEGETSATIRARIMDEAIPASALAGPDRVARKWRHQRRQGRRLLSRRAGCDRRRRAARGLSRSVPSQGWGTALSQHAGHKGPARRPTGSGEDAG